MKIDVKNWEKIEDDFPEKEKIVKKKDKNKKKKDNSIEKGNAGEEDVLFR